ncbi:MAG: hypothetical protein B7733_12080 [Myxococcales bacterium FL481]|nr:MAG: hypothetical protein B7733_12080 [Myxococcales bacterium FL481]
MTLADASDLGMLVTLLAAVAVARGRRGPWTWLVAWAGVLAAVALVLGLLAAADGSASLASPRWWRAIGGPVLELVALGSVGSVLVEAQRLRQPTMAAAALVGVTAVRAVGSAGDGLVVLLALWLAGATQVIVDRHAGPDRSALRHQRAWSQHLVWFSMLALGAALMYGATSDTTFEGFRGRALAVFNRWGAAQPFVDAMSTPRLAPAYLRHYRREVVDGMAPAALLLPGVLIWIAGLVAGLVEWPRGWSRAGDPRLVAVWRVGVVRMVSLIVLVRFVAVELATPLFSARPYGVADAVMWLGAAVAVAACGEGWRVRSVRRFAGAVGGAHVGVGVAVFGLGVRAGAFGEHYGDAVPLAVLGGVVTVIAATGLGAACQFRVRRFAQLTAATGRFGGIAGIVFVPLGVAWLAVGLAAAAGGGTLLGQLPLGLAFAAQTGLVMRACWPRRVRSAPPLP